MGDIMSMILEIIGVIKYYWKEYFYKKIEEDYPKCIAGQGTCPPKDCGGTQGFMNLLEIISEPKHKEYKEIIEWIGRKYNPDEFSPDLVKFSHTARRIHNYGSKT